RWPPTSNASARRAPPPSGARGSSSRACPRSSISSEASSKPSAPRRRPAPTSPTSASWPRPPRKRCARPRSGLARRTGRRPSSSGGSSTWSAHWPPSEPAARRRKPHSQPPTGLRPTPSPPRAPRLSPRPLPRRVKVTKTWRRRRALRSIPAAELRPGRLAAAGIWLDPLHLLRALAELVEPAWTEGHDFVVFHEVTGPRSRRMWVRATSGEPLAVLPEPPPQQAAVTVHSTPSAFQRFLGGEPN